MSASLIKQFSIGLELEANVIHSKTGQPVIDFNNSESFSQLDGYLRTHNICALQSEFDAATVELITTPCTTIKGAFQQLRHSLFHATQYLKKQDSLLLLLGLHPGRESNDLHITNKERCYDSLPLLSEHGSLFYCSLQINLGFPAVWNEHLLTLCHALQAHMWPCSVITQSSSVFANRYSHYQCFREHLNDELSHYRSGPLPAEINTWEAFQKHCAHLPGEDKTKRKNNVWFDIFPKPLDEQNPDQGYRIEVRLADTSGLNQLYYFTQAIVLTYFTFLEKILNHEPLVLPQQAGFLLNREQILKKGRQAELTLDGKSFLSLKNYFTDYWQPLTSAWFQPLGIMEDELIPHLLAETRSESMIYEIEKISGNQIALRYAEKDAADIASYFN